eukprot:13412750-Heterocapsa_arctica.AAC.1
MVQLLPAADPDAVQRELGDGEEDGDGPDGDTDLEQQFFSENDDPPPEDPAAEQEAVDETLLGMTPAQRA